MATKKTKKKPAKRRAKKKSGLVQITSPVKKDVKFFVATELADDKLIVRELIGEVSKTLVYEYKDESGQTVRGLSYQGVKEAVRIINRNRKSGHTIQISDKPPMIEDMTANSQEGVQIMVYAQDIESGGGSWGIKFEPYQRQINDGKGSTEFNRFARETALSKAQRNAMFNLLPAQFIEEVIAELSEETKNVEQIKAPKTETREIKPKASNDEKMYKATLDRVVKVSNNKKSLEQALNNIEKLPISNKQRAQIKRKIGGYLKKL